MQPTGNRWFARAASATAIIVALAGLASVPAQADPYDQCNSDTGCEPDNRDHTFCYYGAFANNQNLVDAAVYAMTNVEDQTLYFKDKVDTCTTITDVILIKDDTLPARGAYACQGWNSAGECEFAYLWINPDALNDDLNRKKTLCHEIGHSLGLTHHDDPYDDCMVSGPVNAGHKEYNSHHVNHADNRS